jgi:hypothetical protein
MTRLWSISKPNRLTPAGDVTMLNFGRSHRHANEQAEGDG